MAVSRLCQTGNEELVPDFEVDQFRQASAKERNRGGILEKLIESVNDRSNALQVNAILVAEKVDQFGDEMASVGLIRFSFGKDRVGGRASRENVLDLKAGQSEKEGDTNSLEGLVGDVGTSLDSCVNRAIFGDDWRESNSAGLGAFSDERKEFLPETLEEIQESTEIMGRLHCDRSSKPAEASADIVVFWGIRQKMDFLQNPDPLRPFERIHLGQCKVETSYFNLSSGESASGQELPLEEWGVIREACVKVEVRFDGRKTVDVGVRCSGLRDLDVYVEVDQRRHFCNEARGIYSS